MMKKQPIKNGIEEIHLDNCQEVFDLIGDVFNGSAFIYRGQSDYNWPIVSSLDRWGKRYWGRKNLGGDIPPVFNREPFTEEEHLNAFKRAIRGRRGENPPPLDENDLWALGQHHGLVTPLLDWTRSPFIALFFAFEEEKCLVDDAQWVEPEYRGLYILSTSTIVEAAKEGVPSVHVLSPENDANYRLINQAALHVRMPRNTDLESYVNNNFEGDIHRATLTKIRIPNNDRHGCLIALNKMNINYMSLFPDIDGAARHVNSLWQPGHEDSIAYI